MTKALPVLGVIPARAHSSRFPFKVIYPILGKSLLQHVWENAQQAGVFSRLLVATDHPDIVKVVQAFGGEAILTPSFESGSDRVAFIAKEYGHGWANVDVSSEGIVLNLQGDEPLLGAYDIERLVRALQENSHWDIATLAVRKTDGTEIADPHVVKVVVNAKQEALYFSRSALTSSRSGAFLKHIGIYAYRRETLFRFCQIPPTELEQTEKLEQLRALENGMRIGVVEIANDTIAVDVPDDILKVEKRLLEQRSLI